MNFPRFSSIFMTTIKLLLSKEKLWLFNCFTKVWMHFRVRRIFMTFNSNFWALDDRKAPSRGGAVAVTLITKGSEILVTLAAIGAGCSAGLRRCYHKRRIRHSCQGSLPWHLITRLFFVIQRANLTSQAIKFRISSRWLQWILIGLIS